MSERSVLVVDDDPAVRRVVRAVLEADGFAVLEAGDGATALALLGASDGEVPRIVILDVMMPGLDGVDVLRRLDCAEVRVVMLTARDDTATREASLASGADAYLTKPFSAIELLDTIEAARQRAAR
jgi:DNA-binding response OmpR family regulator